MDSTRFKFPTPTFKIDSTGVNDAADATAFVRYLSRVHEWRRVLRDQLRDAGGAPSSEGLTDRARQALRTGLDTEWSSDDLANAKAGPYNISCFPAPAETGEEPRETVVAILRWRAAVVDYLSDVWDVMSEPTLTLDECNAIGRLLAPAGTETRCGYCLAILEKSQHRGKHQCWVVAHLRSEWPPSPFQERV